MDSFGYHLRFFQMVDLIEGRLTLDDRAQLERHITACLQCSNEMAKLQHLLDLMRTDSSEDAPQAVMARAVHLFTPRAIRATASNNPRRRLLSELRFDSQRHALSFGVRSGGAGPRQLLFAAVGFDTDVRIYEIDLRIESADQGWVVSGQLLGAPAIGRLAELKNATRRERTTLNMQNEFVLPAVQSGQYTLILHLINVDLEVGGLDLGI